MIDDATGKGTCIVDLDTVKPGLIHYDFGDCLRSCCNPAGEEVVDLTRVYFDTDMCEAIVKGYMANAKEFLTDADRHYLYDSVQADRVRAGPAVLRGLHRRKRLLQDPLRRPEPEPGARSAQAHREHRKTRADHPGDHRKALDLLVAANPWTRPHRVTRPGTLYCSSLTPNPQACKLTS